MRALQLSVYSSLPANQNAGRRQGGELNAEPLHDVHPSVHDARDRAIGFPHRHRSLETRLDLDRMDPRQLRRYVSARTRTATHLKRNKLPFFLSFFSFFFFLFLSFFKHISALNGS